MGSGLGEGNRPRVPGLPGLGIPEHSMGEGKGKLLGKHHQPGQEFVHMGVVWVRGYVWGRDPDCSIEDSSPATGPWPCPFLRSLAPLALLLLSEPCPPTPRLSQEPSTQLLTLPVPQDSHF